MIHFGPSYRCKVSAFASISGPVAGATEGELESDALAVADGDSDP
jgi:hypothetical protein